jgi:phytoene dehydrogenase-like protein
VGVHYLGSLREKGVLSEILRGLDLLDRIKLIRNDPTDRIITPDKTIFIRKDQNKTINELISHFPKEKENIKRLFNLIINEDFLSLYSKLRNRTFQDLLDIFLTDHKLKAILSTMLGNLGLSSSQSSGFVGAIIYKEFVLDGGYYPKGGIQNLPDLLAEKFREYGGVLLLSNRVTRIMTKQKKVMGVKLQDKGCIVSKFVVSNVDAHLTFNTLLDCECNERKVVNKLKISNSAFVVYLGLKKQLNIKPKHFTTWFFSTYDIEKCYNFQSDKKKQLIPSFDYLLCSFPSLIDKSLVPSGKGIMRIFVGARYASVKMWENSKNELYNKIITRASRMLPDLAESIELKVIGTPRSFYNYTSNRNGALFGWQALPSQTSKSIFPYQTSIKNLYLSGHWVTNGMGQSGISVVALSGREAAKIIVSAKG